MDFIPIASMKIRERNQRFPSSWRSSKCSEPNVSNQRRKNAPGNEYLLLNPHNCSTDAPTDSTASAPVKHGSMCRSFLCSRATPTIRFLAGKIGRMPMNSVFNAGAVRLADGDTLLALPRGRPQRPVALVRGAFSEWNQRMAHRSPSRR